MGKQTLNSEVEKTCYSKQELGEFRQIILRKLEKAKQNLLSLTVGHNNGTDDTYCPFKVLEEGCNVLSKEVNGKAVNRQEKFINSLENALVRIENKTYGVCRVTGKLIPKERLRSVPHTILSIEGKGILAQRKMMK